MPDLLVKLYALPPLSPLTEKLAEKNIVIRPPIGPENYAVIDWIRTHFGAGWAGEAENAFFRTPKSIFVAVRETTDENGEVHGIIGDAGPVDFYRRCCGAVVIENSNPGVYRAMLH